MVVMVVGRGRGLKVNEKRTEMMGRLERDVEEGIKEGIVGGSKIGQYV